MKFKLDAAEFKFWALEFLRDAANVARHSLQALKHGAQWG